MTDTLYISDQELMRRLGVGEKRGRAAIRDLEARGLPKKGLFGKRYWPAVRLFLDRLNGLSVASSPALQPAPGPTWREHWDEQSPKDRRRAGTKG